MFLANVQRRSDHCGADLRQVFPDHEVRPRAVAGCGDAGSAGPLVRAALEHGLVELAVLAVMCFAWHRRWSLPPMKLRSYCVVWPWRCSHSRAKSAFSG